MKRFSVYCFYIFTVYLSLCTKSAERTLFRKPAVDKAENYINYQGRIMRKCQRVPHPIGARRKCAENFRTLWLFLELSGEGSRGS